MEIITLQEIKLQCRIDGDEEDALLTAYGDAAEHQVCNMTARSFDELRERGGGDWPPPLKVAALLLAAHWYRQREAVAPGSANAVPYAVEYLTRPYTRLTQKNE